jgi:hypothetical protein
MAVGRVHIEVAELTDDDLHEIGMAIATLEAAVGNESATFRAYSARTGVSHATVVGDGLVMALAMRGFVVVHNHTIAAEIAAKYERAPEQGAKLS